jgi:hypothetical protein
MILSKREHAVCPVRDKMLVENKRHAPAARPVRDGIWIKTD